MPIRKYNTPQSTPNVVIIHNIITPYKTLLINELYKIRSNLKVLYMAETESNRDWFINKDEMKFPYEIVSDGKLQNHNRFKIAAKIWRRLNYIRPDVIILGGYIYPSCWLGFIWSKLKKKKVILWSSTTQTDHNRKFLKEKVKSLFIKRCDAANVYGYKSRDYLAKLGLKQDAIFIKGNTTDNSFYHTHAAELRKKRDIFIKETGLARYNFLYIGRFSEEKNIFHLLRAYKKLEPQNNWGLILVGDGPLNKEITGYIKNNSIKNVFMPGFQQKENVPKFLAVSDIFILPSTSETWGLVVNEAMAAGLPVFVSKKCGCYPDLIKEGINGFSFDPFDEDELFDLMSATVNGKYDLKKMGAASMEIIKDYTPHKAAEVIAKTIEFVLS